MATHDYNIANQSFPSFRTDLNNALSAVKSSNSAATAPTTSLVTGQLFYDTTNSSLKVYNGSAFSQVGNDPASVLTITNSTAAVSTTTGALRVTGGISTQNNLYAAGTLNITGTSTLGNLTISSTKTINMGANKITSVADPASAQDAATKAYVDAATPSLGGDLSGSVDAAQIVANAVGAPEINETAKVQVGGLGVGTAASTTTGEIRATNNITAYYSDDRLKIKTGNITNALEKTISLNGFKYIENSLANSFGYTSGDTYVGVSAQEVQKVLPEAVKPAPFDLDKNNKSKSGEDYLTVQYEKLVPLLIESIKALNNKIQYLESKLGV